MTDPWWRKDRGQFYIRVKDPITGNWRNRATGATSIREAREVQRQVESGLRSQSLAAERNQPEPPRSSKLRELTGCWLERREKRGLRDVENDRSRLDRHVLPVLGDMAVAEIRPKHVVALVEGLREQQTLAPRSIRKTYGVLHKLFADLVLDEVVERSPCVLTKDQLPKNIDKDREWRAGAIFERGEAEILVSSEAIADDRRMFNGLALLTGARLGEIAALRWGDYDDRAEPLGRLSINRSFAGPLKSEVPREVPVHPVLAAMLGEWRLRGFSQLMGRAPRADDLIVPSRQGEMRSKNQVRGKFLDDLKRLGLRPRRVHDMRRTFITLARVDGARPDILEQVTHGVRGNIMNVYTTLPWPTLCDAVSGVNVRRLGADVVRVRLVANARREAAATGGDAETHASTADFAPGFAPVLDERTRFVRKSWTTHVKSKLKLVEAPGIEDDARHRSGGRRRGARAAGGVVRPYLQAAAGGLARVGDDLRTRHRVGERAGAAAAARRRWRHRLLVARACRCGPRA